MRVLHVIPSMSPKLGGAPAAVRGLTLALARQGVRCEIVTTRGPVAGTDALPVPGVPVHRFDTEFPAPFWPGFSRKLGAFLDAEARRFDLVHSHQTLSYSTYAAFRAARNHALPYVLSLRGELAEECLRHKRYRKWIYRQVLLNGIVRSADALHIVSRAEASHAAVLGYHTPTFLVPNGIFLDEAVPPATVDLTVEYPRLAGKRVILFIGRLHWVKGLDVLARSFAMVAGEFPDSVLLVVGPDEGARGTMESILRSNGVLEQAVFTGLLTGDHKRAAFQCADLLVMPSYSEGFSNAILEALGASLPVVISDRCNLPEVAEHGAGFVVPSNDMAVCEAIGKLLSDDGLGARMGHNGRNLVTERYTWQSSAASMVDRYRSLLRTSP